MNASNLRGVGIFGLGWDFLVMAKIELRRVFGSGI